MEVIRINNIIPHIDNLACCIGQFDGLHVAHQELIKLTKQIALKNNLKSGMITFDPHPDFVLKKDLFPAYLTPIDEKIKLLEKYQLDYLIIIHFTLAVASLKKEIFVNDYLMKMGVQELICGFDFRFSQKGEGKPEDIELLSSGKIHVHIVDEIKINDDKIGSTLVKKLLQEGKMEEVNTLLNRPYHVKGKVIKGSGLGHTYDIPTANLKIENDFYDLKNGVYQVEVEIDNNFYQGIGNFGHNPSFNLQDNARLEVYVFDYHGDLYGKVITVYFQKYIRKEQKFSSIEELKKQILKDIDSIR